MGVLVEAIKDSDLIEELAFYNLASIINNSSILGPWFNGMVGREKAIETYESLENKLGSRFPQIGEFKNSVVMVDREFSEMYLSGKSGTRILVFSGFKYPIDMSEVDYAVATINDEMTANFPFDFEIVRSKTLSTEKPMTLTNHLRSNFSKYVGSVLNFYNTLHSNRQSTGTIHSVRKEDLIQNYINHIQKGENYLSN